MERETIEKIFVRRKKKKLSEKIEFKTCERIKRENAKTNSTKVKVEINQ